MSKALRKQKADGGKMHKEGAYGNVAYKGRRKKAAGKNRKKKHDKNIK